MALSALKTFIDAETLTHTDLNALNTNILDNALALISPLTGNLNANGNLFQNIGAMVMDEASSPTTGANEGALWAAVQSSVTELMMRGESDGTATQVTTSGMTKLRSAVLDSIPGLGPNLLRNGGEFRRLSATATVAPDGWDLISTPSDITLNASDASEAGTNKVQITSDANTEGISQTLDATVLKASTTYTVFAKYKVNSGDTATIETTGASSNLSKTGLAATTFTEVTGTFATDATPASVVFRLVAEDATDVVHFDNCMIVEGSVAPDYAIPHQDDHRAIVEDFQDDATTDFKIGNVRFEMGQETSSAGGLTTVTFPVAFGTILGVQIQAGSNEDAGVESVGTTSFQFDIRDSGNARVAVLGYWIAYGID